MSDLRVAFFTGNYNGVIDGVALSSNRQVKALLVAGAAVRVYAPVKDKALIVPHVGDLVPVPSIHLVEPYRLALGLTPKVRQDLVDFRPNLVHLASPDWLGFSAQEHARRRKIPVVATFHTHFAHYARYYNVGFLEGPCWSLIRFFYGRKRCRAVYVACQSMIDELKAQRVDAPFETLPFGVDTERFTPAKRSSEFRTRHGFAETDVVAIFVGRLVWEKGLVAFAETVKRLQGQGLPLKALVVGEGPAKAGFRERLTNAVFTGRLQGDDLPTAFASADLFFFPSASETFGLVSLEALASGLPCVVADATGSKDIVTHDVNGLLGRTDDVDSFAIAVSRLVNDRELRTRFSRAARQAATELTWPKVMDRMVRAFHRAAGLSAGE